MTEQSVQERYAPQNICFGCGPANPKGLRIRSFLREGELLAEWKPEPHHQAFPGAVNGGIIGALMDCHSNWAAALHLMEAQKLDHLLSTVTAQYAIKLRRPLVVHEQNADAALGCAGLLRACVLVAFGLVLGLAELELHLGAVALLGVLGVALLHAVACLHLRLDRSLQ